MKLLLAEDDRATQLRIASYVREWGFTPITANNGAEAWELFQAEDIRCVVSDWMMPKMDGLELVRRIRQAETENYVYVILLTGQTDKRNLVEGMEAGSDDFLTKPFDKDELRVRLRAGERIIELERRLEERNRELSMFTSVASHDLREPLRTISSFIGLLERKYEGQLDKDGLEYMKFIVDGAARMRALITDLLEYARMSAQQKDLEPVDMAEIVQERLTSLGASIRECGAEVTVGNLPTVHGDRTQLSQLIQNLIGNGIKYRGDASPIIHVEAVELGDEWQFSIRDNGIGIPSEHQSVIFEPFKRLHGTGSKYGGSGVGLAICKKVVDRHGGRIWVEPSEGGGSTFYFTLRRQEKGGEADA